MASEVGAAYVSIVPSTKGFGKTLSGQVAGPSATAGKTSGTRFRTGLLGGLKGIGKGVGVALAAGAVGTGALFKSSITAASDLNETVSKVNQILGAQAMPGLQKFAARAASDFGQSKQSALDAIATFATFGKAAGLQGSGLASFSTNLTSLSSDMASFSNTTPQEAIEAIGAALRGESEPIRRYGVLLDEATLKAEAMKLGLVKATKDSGKITATQLRLTAAQQRYNEVVKEHGKGSREAISAEASLVSARGALKKATEGSIGPLTQQQRVLAAQSQIFKQTKDAQGDFGRTSGGLANQQRILVAQFDNAKTELGQGLLPVALTVVKFLNAKAIPAFKALGGFIVSNLLPRLKALGAFIGDFTSGFHGASDNMAGFHGVAQKVGEVVLRLGLYIRGTVIPALVRFGAFFRAEILPRLAQFASFVRQKVAPVLGGILTKALDGAKSAFQSIRAAIERNRPQLEQLAGGFKAVIGFVVAKVLPVLGPLLREAFKQIGGYITRTIDIIGLFIQGFQAIGRVAIPALAALVKFFLGAVGLIINGAAKALGWVPGLGGKLKGAANAFNGFKDRTAVIMTNLANEAKGWGKDTADNYNRALAANIRKGSGGKVSVGTATGTANKLGAMRADVRGVGGGGDTFIINNPKPEPASESVPKAIRRKKHRQGVSPA